MVCAVGINLAKFIMQSVVFFELPNLTVISDVICELMFVILHTSICQLKCRFLYSPAYNLVACSRYILDLFCATLGHYLLSLLHDIINILCWRHNAGVGEIC